MNRFIASNNVIIDLWDEGYIDYTTSGDEGYGDNLEGQAVDALREFFRAVEDEGLGRWRWSKDPTYVVYPGTPDATDANARGVTVLNEAIPRIYTVWEHNVETFYGDSQNEDARMDARRAAAAYFAAHPPEPEYTPTIKEQIAELPIGARFHFSDDPKTIRVKVSDTHHYSPTLDGMAEHAWFYGCSSLHVVPVD